MMEAATLHGERRDEADSQSLFAPDFQTHL